MFKDINTHNFSKFLPYSLWKISMELIKGKQTFLLIYTAFFSYLLSAYPSGIRFDIVVLLTTSLFLSISGSTLLNMYIDRDIDALMERTKDRPLPSGQIRPRVVLIHGLVFSLIGLSLAYFINVLTLIVISLGVFFDVVIYSLWLKRKSKWSVIFGGVAGGLPAVAGRISFTNQFDLISLFILLIILIWIPIHILSLATLPINFEGYINAEIPMWPVTSGIEQTRTLITGSAILEAIIIVLTGVFLEINILTLIPLILMASVLLYKAGKNLRNPTQRGTLTLFKFASIFMAIVFLWLFIAVVISPQLDSIIYK